jgi:Mg2+/Co2+ transporter CorB
MDAEIFLIVFAVFILILLSGFFSGSETALTAASRARMHNLAKAGKKRASLVNKILEKKERMIGAILLGNNLVNILASALATSLFIKMAGETGVLYATVVMTLLVLIFAEVLPKTYALHTADKMAMTIAPVMRWVIVLLSPITEMVSWIVRNVLKLFGKDISVLNVGDHVELLRGAIDLHQGPEKETSEQRAMLRSILDLAEVDVCEIMTHRKNVTMIDVDEDIETIVAQVLDSPYTRLPVYRNSQDNIIGVIHAKWLLRELKDQNHDLGKIEIEKIASAPWFIPESTSLYDQLQVFRNRREHFALVVDEYGSFMGIVTLEDILEEIVGEIDDEHDIAVAGVRKIPGGGFLVDGTVTIRDLNREFDWELPDEDYSTVAGLILFKSQRIPESGQSFNYYGFRFDIVRRQRNQITLLRITPPYLMPAE